MFHRKGGKGSTHLHRKSLLKRWARWWRWWSWGHVYLVGNKGLWTLFHLKFTEHIKAGNGGDGSGDRSTGADGDDKYRSSIGTVVKIKETGILFEITEGEASAFQRR
jgi:GTP-binding protein